MVISTRVLYRLISISRRSGLDTKVIFLRPLSRIILVMRVKLRVQLKGFETEVWIGIMCCGGVRCVFVVFLPNILNGVKENR